MSRMPLYALVLYIATRLFLDGHVVDESMVALFGRAGLHLAEREILADGAADDEADDNTIHCASAVRRHNEARDA